MYAISASHLLKSLKLEVQHCIDLSDPSLCKYLKFAIAPVHTSSLPYQFNIVEGGEFPANSHYGSIERSKFCLLGIVGEEKKNGGQNNGEQGNVEQEQNIEGQEQNNGEQQEQSNGHEDSKDKESGDEGKGENQLGASGQQQQGGGAERQQGEGRRGDGEGEESGGQEQLQESHLEKENVRQQGKGEAHQKKGKEKQQQGSEHHRQPTKDEKEENFYVIKAPEVCTESDQSTHFTISKLMMSPSCMTNDYLLHSCT